MSIYSVVNIDVVGSRKLKDRGEKQEIIKCYIEKVEKEFEKLLVAPITWTLGDEWQIVLNKPSKSYYVIERFQKLLKSDGIDIYAGIGIGKLQTNIYKDTRLMDGECFIRARQALEIAKKKNRFYNDKINSKENNIYFDAKEIKLSSIYEHLYKSSLMDVAATSCKQTNLIDIDMNKDVFENNLFLNKIINTLIENNEVLKSRITKKQTEIIELYEDVGSYSNIISKNKNISKSSISQKLNDSNYFVIENNRFMIALLLNFYSKICGGNINEF